MPQDRNVRPKRGRNWPSYLLVAEWAFVWDTYSLPMGTTAVLTVGTFDLVDGFPSFRSEEPGSEL